MTDASGPRLLDLHPARPCVYLDQWVWIRLARAANGEPKEASDLRVLTAVQDAAESGVAFPLSTTHYIETSKVTNPRQRHDVAKTMAFISHCRTLRARNVLLRHQMLWAMHLTFGRPAFRPQIPEVLGTGIQWAFAGEPGHGVLRGQDGTVINPAATDGMAGFLRRANQITEMRMLAGPSDDDIDELREDHGYRPEMFTQVEASRLGWEKSYLDVLAEYPASKTELRVRLQARELIHEHQAMFQALLREYRVNLEHEFRHDPGRPKASRPRMVAFADAMPTMRIAVDLKMELFRGAGRPWNINAVHDIDALSMAVPYCHVVVPDGEMVSLLSRSRAADRNGTQIITSLPDLPDALPSLVERARDAPGDRTGWDWAGPWDGYCLDLCELASGIVSRSPAA